MTNNTNYPLLMTEDIWTNTYLSIARHCGGIPAPRTRDGDPLLPYSADVARRPAHKPQGGAPAQKTMQ